MLNSHVTEIYCLMKPPSSLDGRFTQIRSVRIGVWLLDDSLLQRPQHPIILLSTVCLSHEGLFMKGVFCLKIYALLEEVLVGHLKLMLPFLPVLTMTYCDPFCKR
ncbi:hypothetical protein L1987_41355 [Smallanthus sonchifolius]|uniref:Uncharacterized protein n=1 Tax=Smallanthus sonchifolius TaxID=185202 RepID=A0ACB9GUF1_9ASTR|nr:hypothetical protein L1987_41355 [Smallanthus sonchifolius]